MLTESVRALIMSAFREVCSNCLRVTITAIYPTAVFFGIRRNCPRNDVIVLRIDVTQMTKVLRFVKKNFSVTARQCWNGHTLGNKNGRCIVLSPISYKWPKWQLLYSDSNFSYDTPTKTRPLYSHNRFQTVILSMIIMRHHLCSILLLGSKQAWMSDGLTIRPKVCYKYITK